MSTRRRVSFSQLATLYEHLAKNPTLATGRNKNSQAREDHRIMWTNLAELLNSDDGAVKSWRDWSKYWIDYKSKLRIKAAEPDSTINLSELDKKFLCLISSGSTQGTKVEMELSDDSSDPLSDEEMPDLSDMPMSQAAARKELVESANRREALAVRQTELMELILEELREIKQALTTRNLQE